MGSGGFYQGVQGAFWSMGGGSGVVGVVVAESLTVTGFGYFSTACLIFVLGVIRVCFALQSFPGAHCGRGLIGNS